MNENKFAIKPNVIKQIDCTFIIITRILNSQSKPIKSLEFNDDETWTVPLEYIFNQVNSIYNRNTKDMVPSDNNDFDVYFRLALLVFWSYNKLLGTPNKWNPANLSEHSSFLEKTVNVGAWHNLKYCLFLSMNVIN